MTKLSSLTVNWENRPRVIHRCSALSKHDSGRRTSRPPLRAIQTCPLVTRNRPKTAWREKMLRATRATGNEGEWGLGGRRHTQNQNLVFCLPYIIARIARPSCSMPSFACFSFPLALANTTCRRKPRKQLGDPNFCVGFPTSSRTTHHHHRQPRRPCRDADPLFSLLSSVRNLLAAHHQETPSLGDSNDLQQQQQQ